MGEKEIEKILKHFYKKHNKKLEKYDIEEMIIFLNESCKNEDNDKLLGIFRFCYLNMDDFSGKIEELIDFFINRMENLREKFQEAEGQLRLVVKNLIEHKKGKNIPVFKDIITKKLFNESFSFKELASHYKEIEDFKKDFLRSYKSYRLVQPLIDLEDEKILKQSIIIW